MSANVPAERKIARKVKPSWRTRGAVSEKRCIKTRVSKGFQTKIGGASKKLSGGSRVCPYNNSRDYSRGGPEYHGRRREKT